MSLKPVPYIFIFCLYISSVCTKQFTIMLDPAGDAQTTGKIIGNTFERKITLEFAQELKQNLERKNGSLRVVLTRFPGETVQHLQHANFANRLGVDLFIHISFFSSTSKTIHCFYFCIDPVTDFWHKDTNTLNFIPSCNAHFASIHTSLWYTENIINFLQKQYRDHITVHAPLGIAYKPLHGILAPAFGIEMSIQTAQDWSLYIQPIAEALNTAIHHYKKQ